MFKSHERGLIELPGEYEGEEVPSFGDWEYPFLDENPEENIDKIVARESYQKVELFCLNKKAKNMWIYALADGTYIAERLDDKGEQKEVYYFNKQGDLLEFEDRTHTKKESIEAADKIIKSFENIQKTMVEMLEKDSVYSKKV